MTVRDRFFFIIFLFIEILFNSCTSYDTSSDIQDRTALVPVNLSFQLSEHIQAGEVSSSTETKSGKTSPFNVSYVPSDVLKTKASTSFTNVWVLQFYSNGTCAKAVNLGTVSTTNINPTLVSGSDYTICVIANGPSSPNAFDSVTESTLESTFVYAESISGDAPYIGTIDGVSISTDGVLNSGSSQSPTILLTRVAAKVSLSLNYNVSGYTLQSVEMYNAPKNMYYLNGKDASVFPAASSTTINQSALTANVKPSTVTSGTYVWYVGENKRGTNSLVTTPYDRDFMHTPTINNSQYFCTYIRIKAKRNDGLGEINYYIYPGGNNTTDFNVIRNYDYNLNVMMQGNAVSQESMEGGDGRVRIASSNCYMVTPSSTITIPVNIKVNANQPIRSEQTDNTVIGGITHTATSVSILWQTSPGLIRSISGVYNGKVNITTSSGSGNAVVAAYNGSTIIWSWHIWVTNYNSDTPSDGTTYTFNNRVWMDRNLGATSANIVTSSDISSYGMIYQWGRKDPFTSSRSINAGGYLSMQIYNSQGSLLDDEVKDDTSKKGIVDVLAPSNALGNVAYSIAHPSWFIYGTPTNSMDWYSNAENVHNPALWGGVSIVASTPKTIYDPCPRGWRVPAWENSLAPWNGLASYNSTSYWNNGYDWRTYGGAGYYPAVGLRYAGDGTISSPGTHAYYGQASSSPLDNSLSNNLDFGNGNVIPNNTHCYRADGYSIRCVKE